MSRVLTSHLHQFGGNNGANSGTVADFVVTRASYVKQTVGISTFTFHGQSVRTGEHYPVDTEDRFTRLTASHEGYFGDTNLDILDLAFWTRCFTWLSKAAKV